MPGPISDTLDNDPLGTGFIAAIAIDRPVWQVAEPELMPMVSMAAVVFRDSRGALIQVRASLVPGNGFIKCRKQNEYSCKRDDEAGHNVGLSIHAHGSFSLFI